ncbi:MAG TPA: HlyD family efflux transporter periplasmic adaptor subunit, partial [Puia sp.]
QDTHWILRTGNIALLGVLIALLSATCFVRYPDIINGSLKLAAINAPKLVTAKTDGKIQKLLITNEMQVGQGQYLGFMQSTAQYPQVLELEHWIASVESHINRGSFDILTSSGLPLLNNLGEIQPAYQEFENIWKETQQLFPKGYYRQKQETLLKDLGYIDSLRDNQWQQHFLLQEDYDLQQTEYRNNESLARDKVIASLELNQNKSKLIGKEEMLRQSDARLINSNIDRLNKEKEIGDLKKFDADQRQKFRSGLFNLKSKIEEWESQYAIIAPESGKILYTAFLEENQWIDKGQELLYVEPPQSKYYGQLLVPQSGLGKIRIGQKVLIRMQSYPSEEFGYLKGAISYISNIPSAKDSFLIRVDLPAGMRTNTGKNIFFRNSLVASAEVITDDRRLVQRILGPLSNIFRF